MTDNKNRCDFNSIKVLIDNKYKKRIYIKYTRYKD